MYVVWKTRELRGSRPCEVCGVTGHTHRFSLIPHLVTSRRIDGIPRQVHVARLASIRSCCLNCEKVLKAWWRQVEATLDELPEAEAAKLRRLLRERIVRMKNEGTRGRARQKDTSRTHFPSYLASQLRVLGLRWPCRIEEAKAAYRVRAKQTHPDLGGRPEDFRIVADAYAKVVKALAG